jgi:hypothetical protein
MMRLFDRVVFVIRERLLCAAAFGCVALPVACQASSDPTSETSNGDDGASGAESDDDVTGSDDLGSDDDGSGGAFMGDDSGDDVSGSDDDALDPDNTGAGGNGGDDADPGDGGGGGMPHAGSAGGNAMDAGAPLPADELCDANRPPPPDCDGAGEFVWGGHCYFLSLPDDAFAPQASFESAETICGMRGATLWSINCLEEMKGVAEQWPEPDGNIWSVYTGGIDPDGSGAWEWVSGDPWDEDFLDPAEIEPVTDGGQGARYCLVLVYGSGVFNQVATLCRGSLPYVCER